MSLLWSYIIIIIIIITVVIIIITVEAQFSERKMLG